MNPEKQWLRSWYHSPSLLHKGSHMFQVAIKRENLVAEIHNQLSEF